MTMERTKRTPNYKPRNPVSKTLYIEGVTNDDFESFGNSTNVATHLQEKRNKLLKSIVEQIGKVESIEFAEPTVLVTFITREEAEAALLEFRGVFEYVTEEDRYDRTKTYQRRITKRDKLVALVREAEKKLIDEKLCKSICPDFLSYRYGWSKFAANPITVLRKPVKNVVAGLHNPPLIVRARKVTVDKKPTTAADKKLLVPRVETAKVKEEEATEAPVNRGVKEIQREAEIASISRDISYHKNQVTHVKREISMEIARAETRNKVIEQLSRDLMKAETHVENLRNRLINELEWKQVTDNRINTLYREAEYFLKENKALKLKMSGLKN